MGLGMDLLARGGRGFLAEVSSHDVGAEEHGRNPEEHGEVTDADAGDRGPGTLPGEAPPDPEDGGADDGSLAERPLRPHPTPKTAAPMMVRLLSVRCRLVNSPPSMGWVTHRGTRLIVIAVTRAALPNSTSNPKSLSCKKLSTISWCAMPPMARPKPKSMPPTNTTRYRVLMGSRPRFGRARRLRCPRRGR